MRGRRMGGQYEDDAEEEEAAAEGMFCDDGIDGSWWYGWCGWPMDGLDGYRWFPALVAEMRHTILFIFSITSWHEWCGADDMDGF